MSLALLALLLQYQIPANSNGTNKPLCNTRKHKKEISPSPCFLKIVAITSGQPPLSRPPSSDRLHRISQTGKNNLFVAHIYKEKQKHKRSITLKRSTTKPRLNNMRMISKY